MSVRLPIIDQSPDITISTRVGFPTTILKINLFTSKSMLLTFFYFDLQSLPLIEKKIRPFKK